MKKIYRSKKERKIAGICGGIAELLSIDPTIVRLLYILLMLITGIVPLIIFYLISWWIIPQEQNKL
ncbi:MAG: hypothetical protein IGBAC_0659 [Ignavibacteriae bacterium]|nr:MAG: hypothetical protein IGBAC_0659 [Ignavibacteriota bacterium]